ncbi:MAG: hypothetical protein HKP30_05105 [Myxococcales bacterium]|nr:hypothetical protein [Myxococcales bacterium]
MALPTADRPAETGPAASTLGPRVCAGLLVAALAALLASAARAEPMDLADPDARWVSVRFEVSPPDRPGQTDAVYSAPIAAWLEPDPRAKVSRLTIPGHAIEAELLAAHDPVPGSFSDFVWSFDTVTGHVLSAELEGRVVRTLDWGLVRTPLQARIRFQMNTLRAAGFRSERRLMGQRVNRYCEPGPPAGCIAVAPSRYDGRTGYVNAVGRVDVETRLLRIQTFSTLGEARFSERTTSDGSLERRTAFRVEP